ncbi:hypothetical protein E6P97_03925 [Patescibacteria group bacterium]|nr:MAG: hypothetical protein E6P97_03925 [Patescibacteria group bacterium]
MAKSKSKSSIVSQKNTKGPLGAISNWSIAAKLGALIIIISIVAVGGTFGYTKYKERELQAQAGAFLIARRGSADADVKFAVCKIQAGNRVRVRGIVARKASQTTSTAAMSVFQSGSGGRPGSLYQRAESNAWYWGAVTAMELYVPANGWVGLSYNSSYTDKVFMGYVPYC